MPHSLRNRIHVYRRELFIRLRAFRKFVLSFILVNFVGMILIEEKYNLGWLEAFYQSVSLLFFAQTVPYPTGDTLYEIWWISYPLFALFFLIDGISGISHALKFGDATSEIWNREVIKVMEDHIIVVGVGNLGHRIFEHLRKKGETFCGVDLIEGSEKQEIIENYQREFRIPFIQGDATRESTLEEAGIDKASTLILTIDDDFLNLKIATVARRLNPSLKIIVRIFDLDFGEEIANSLNIQILSTTQIAAPFFVDALN